MSISEAFVTRGARSPTTWAAEAALRYASGIKEALP
jgi:hypothetical protein